MLPSILGLIIAHSVNHWSLPLPYARTLSAPHFHLSCHATIARGPCPRSPYPVCQLPVSFQFGDKMSLHHKTQKIRNGKYFVCTVYKFKSFCTYNLPRRIGGWNCCVNISSVDTVFNSFKTLYYSDQLPFLFILLRLMSVFSCQLPLPLMDLPAGAGFIAFASSTGSFLLWIIAFVGTTHLLSTICCNKKKKEATKESTTPNITVQEPTANNGNQQRSSEATKNSMPLKNDEKKESDPTKTAKSIRASDNNKKNSKNRSSNSGKIKRAVSSNYPQPSISINSRTTDKSIIIPKEQEEKVPKGSAAGNIDEQIRKKSQGELADGLDLLHHFDRPSQKDKVRKDMSKDVKIVDQENMLYITDDASNTEDSSTVSVKATPAANGGKEPMDNLKYAQQVHLEATLTGGKVMEERKSRAAGEKREQNPKNAQGSDYAFKM